MGRTHTGCLRPGNDDDDDEVDDHSNLTTSVDPEMNSLVHELLQLRRVSLGHPGFLGWVLK